MAAILRRERLMYAEPFGGEPLEVRMSLANQALRQYPGLYALAVCCLSNGNTRLITSPTDNNHTALCAEVQLSAGKGDVKFRKRAMPLWGVPPLPQAHWHPRTATMGRTFASTLAASLPAEQVMEVLLNLIIEQGENQHPAPTPRPHTSNRLSAPLPPSNRLPPNSLPHGGPHPL